MINKPEKKLKRQPLYEQLAELLREYIQANYQPGDRMESESALAQKFEVSVLTLRQALSALTQEGIIERCHGKGNYVLDQAANQHIAIYSELDLENAKNSGFFMFVANHLVNTFNNYGYDARIYFGSTPDGKTQPSKPTCQGLWESLDNDHVSCLIMLTGWLNPEWAQPLMDKGIFVFGASESIFPDYQIDREKMIKDALKYLQKRKSFSVSIIGIGDEDAIAPEFKDFLGKETSKHHCQLKEYYNCNFYDPTCSVRKVFQEIWQDKKSRPESLIVLDDCLFRELLKVMFSMQIAIPEDLIIVSHSNKNLDNFEFLPIACLEVDPEEFSEAIINWVLKKLGDSRKKSGKVNLSVKLIEQPALTKYFESNKQKLKMACG